MKCTNNKHNLRLLCIIVCIAALFIGGCGTTEVVIENAYPMNSRTVGGMTGTFFADNLCVSDTKDIRADEADSDLAGGAGVFNLDKREVIYSKNIFEKMYPASTTKILTAYIIIRGCNPQDMVTVSETALDLMQGSSVCGISVGDVISVHDLLYGLMLSSGNDAANALAEHYSGSVEEFAKVMNEEARRLGATKSHFVNPHGLPDDEHYTTVYDMYLIFQEAVKLQDFVDIIHTDSYEASFKNRNGETVTKTWKNTNRYISGDETVPEGFQVIGGKTGTTNAAGHCLTLYSTNAKGEEIISIVFKADGRANLYALMSQILSRFAN